MVDPDPDPAKDPEVYLKDEKEEGPVRYEVSNTDEAGSWIRGGPSCCETGAAACGKVT